jgi:hypothetical protein
MTSSGRELEYSWTANKKKGDNVSTVTPSTQSGCDGDVDGNVHGDVEHAIEKLKPFLRYGVQGWQIKRTSKSSWKPIGKESMLVYVNKKLGMSTYDMSVLSSKLLVM